MSEKKNAEAKSAVCLNYAKSFIKVKRPDQAQKLLAKSPETPAKPVNSEKKVDKSGEKKTGAEIAAEFNAGQVEDDSLLNRKSKRGMCVRICKCVLILTRF